MCYRQRAIPAARSCFEKARELAPNDPNIINLLALCEPDSPGAAGRRFQQYQNALELDPENSDVHNNLGVHYLNVEKDFKAAESCFRRSLSLDPASGHARKNLFLALKRRDPVFRTLHAPRDFLLRGLSGVRRAGRRNFLVFLVALPVWFLAARFVMGALALWFLLVWPLVKVYERLTLGDIRAEAGEIAARKGGLFGYHRWPLMARLGIFGAFLVSFWGGAAYCFWRWPGEREAALGLGIGAVLVVLLVQTLRSRSKQNREEANGKKRAEIVASLLSPEPARKSWWSFTRRKPAAYD